MRIRLVIIFFLFAIFSLESGAIENDCIGKLCFSEKGNIRDKKFNSMFSPQVRDAAKVEDGSYCFTDPKRKVSWSLQTFDLHEEKKGGEQIEYVLGASVSTVQHCRRFVEYAYPWRSFQTKRGIKLGATEAEVASKYGSPARRILADQPKSRPYVSKVIGDTTFKEAWIFYGDGQDSLFSTIFVFGLKGEVIGFGIGNSRG